MTGLSYDRHCAELLAQTELLRSSVAGGDMRAGVTGCPGWNLSQLLRHLGGAFRWAETAVRNRADGPVPHDLVDDVGDYADEQAEVLDAWLAEGAAGLVDALHEAGPGRPVWTPGPGGTSWFWARRMLHEAVVHRADAAWAVGAGYTLAGDVAADAVDEWMGFGRVPEVFALRPGEPPLLGPGRTLHFHGTCTGTGTARGGEAHWLVDLTGDAPVWRRSREPAAVSVRAPLADLVLLLYRRRSTSDDTVEVQGDTGLLGLWLERSGFWLRE